MQTIHAVASLSVAATMIGALLLGCSDDEDAVTPGVPDGGTSVDAATPPAPDPAVDAGVDAAVAYAGYAYAATNAADANAVVRYGRTADGKLVTLDTTPTGGVGSGSRIVLPGGSDAGIVDPLFSSDSLVLSSDRRALFVVNAGDDTIASFKIDAADGHLTRAGTYASGGKTPTSVAANGSLLYVSHAVTATGSTTQLTGHRIGADGSLTALATASYPASAPTVVTQVLFSPNGRLLAMIELMTGIIDVFPVTTEGTLGTPVRNASAAPGPFGGEFVDDLTLLVSEVHPGQMNAGSVSSYAVAASGMLTAVSPAVSNGKNATCWLTVTPDRAHVYAGNTTSGDVSSYRLAANGTLTLLNATAASRAPSGAIDFMGVPSSGPVDAFVSRDGQFFYQQYSGLGVVAAYRIGSDGALTAIEGGDGKDLPAIGAEGVAGF